MKDFILGHSDAFLIGACLIVALVISAGIMRGTVGRAVRASLVEIEFQKRCEVEQRERDKYALARRLEINPWNKDGAWNLTRQIEMMRQDFDGAQTLAAEAGVDISHLRGIELYVAPTAMITTWPQIDARRESAVDEPSRRESTVDGPPRKVRKPRKVKLAKKKN
jgi:hypothetical protein